MKKLIVSSALIVGVLFPSSAFAVGTYNGNPIPEANGGVVFCDDGYCYVTDHHAAEQIQKAREEAAKPKPVVKHKAVKKIVRRHNWRRAF